MELNYDIAHEEYLRAKKFLRRSSRKRSIYIKGDSHHSKLDKNEQHPVIRSMNELQDIAKSLKSDIRLSRSTASFSRMPNTLLHLPNLRRSFFCRLDGTVDYNELVLNEKLWTDEWAFVKAMSQHVNFGHRTDDHGGVSLGALRAFAHLALRRVAHK